MSAASLLRCSRGAVRGYYRIFRRSFATQTLEIGNQQRRRQQKQLPWLLLSSPENPESRYLYELSGDDRKPIAFNREIHIPEIAGHHLIGSSQGYLFSVDETAEIHATDPLTGARLPFPSTVALPNFAGVIRDPAGNITHYVTHRHDPPLGNFRPQTVVFERSPRGGCGGEISLFAFLDPKQVGFIDLDFMRRYHIGGILSPSLDTAVVIHKAYSEHSYRPAFARIGSASASASWNALDTPLYNLQDVIFHQGRLHAIDNWGTVEVFDLDDPLGQPFVSPEGPRQSDWYLVESPDREDLFSVCRETEDIPPRTFMFMVFKLDKTTYKWNQVDGIGDVAMFLGSNHSIAFSAAHFSGIIKPNSIYFTDLYRVCSYVGEPEDVGDTGVYNLGDDSTEYYELSDGLHKFNWPPPIWYMPTAR